MRTFTFSLVVSATGVLLVTGCPPAQTPGGSGPPACGAVQICQDLSNLNEPVEDLPLLEGALVYCDRLADGTMAPDELCGYCDQATGRSADEIAYCQDPVAQIVAGELDYVAKLDEVRAQVEDGACAASAGFDSAVVGNCDKNTAFLLLNWVVEGERLQTNHYYDRISGELIGIVRESTIAMPPCCGRYLWPADLSCSNPTVVEAICGSSLRRDDTIDVP